MITIDQERCNACGICVQICHEFCIDLEDHILRIDEEYCSTCTQCIAICPRQALSWDHTEPAAYDKALLPSPGQVDELLKQRRTIRDFKPAKIDKALLEEIVNYAVYAPTHSFDMRALIVDDEQMIQQIDTAIFRFSSRIYRWMYRPKLFHSIVRTFTPSREHEYLKAKPKLETALKRGRNFKTVPPAIIFIVADRRIPLSLESAQYALHSMNLYAHTRGLGCRNLVGNQMFLNRSRKIREQLGLAKHERLFGTMAIGYPAVKFRNKVNGKLMPVQWI